MGERTKKTNEKMVESGGTKINRGYYSTNSDIRSRDESGGKKINRGSPPPVLFVAVCAPRVVWCASCARLAQKRGTMNEQGG